MSEVLHLKKVRIVAFYGGADLARPDALAAAVRDRCRALGQGFDQLLALTQLVSPAEWVFARTVIQLRLPLIAVLPCAEEKLRQASSPEAWAEREPILRAALRVDVRDNTLAPPALWRELVDEADVMVVFEHVRPSQDETRRVIEYAQWQGREVWVIRENPDSPGPDEVTLQVEQGSLEVAPLVKMLGSPPATAPWPEEFLRYAEACGQEANRIAPAYRKYFLNVVLANAVAAMAGTVQLVFEPDRVGVIYTGQISWDVLKTILIVIKFGCVGVGAAIFVILQVRKSQTRWVNARLQAEMCRSARATWRFPYWTDALATAGQPAARETLQFLRYVRARQPALEPVPLEQLKADYGINRLQDQFHYYKGKADSASALSGWLKPLYSMFTALSILAAIVSLLYPHLVDRRHESPLPGTVSYFILGFVPIMAPAFASWLLAWEAIETLGRQKSRYREMQVSLHRALADLVQAESPEAVDEIVERTERMLLSEVQEWYSFIKYSK